MRFDNYPIDPRIKTNLTVQGWKKPTDIQFKAIPSILNGEDVLAIAQTGTGKTAAFAIPLCHLLLSRMSKQRYKAGLKCLVMVPTHELAEQVARVFNDLSQKTPLRTLALYGGVEQDEQIRKLQKGVEILVATPGRLFDLRSQGYLDLSYLEVLVVDEADHMLDMGFIKDIRDLLRYIPERRQTLFFSATINKKIKRLAYSLVKNPIRIQLSPRNPVARRIHHTVAFVEMDDKRFFLERLMKEQSAARVMVFLRTKVRAERLQKAMSRMDIQSQCMHSDVDQQERFEILKAFRKGNLPMLIATDVTARGIDVPEVAFVVNYDIPEQPENYVHRVGRTGRGNRKGYAVSFCSEAEKPLLDDIEAYLGSAIEIFDVDPMEKDLIRDLSTDHRHDLKGLVKDIEDMERRRRKKKK